MSLFILKDGKAAPFDRAVMVALADSGGLAGVVPQYERTWIVVDVEPSGLDGNCGVADWASLFAEWFIHVRNWRSLSPFIGRVDPVHREPFAYVLSLIDLGAILAGEWRGKASWT